MNDRLRCQERYSRKDCVLISNPPFEARNSADVTRDILKFFQSFLGLKIDYNRIKACHLLPGNNAKTTSTVICKFIFYQDKIYVYKKRRSLRNKKNFMNKLNIYMYESLPEFEQEIRNEAHKRDMITSTNNCVVSVLVHDGNEKTKFVKVQEVEELDNLDAVKKRQATERNSVEKLSPHNKRHCFGRE